MHTSPLDQPGTGDSGGMNVYVRELSASLAQTGVEVRVYVRRCDPATERTVVVEPGLTVVTVDAGPPDVPKGQLPGLVERFAEGVAADMVCHPADVVHANYWLSAWAGRILSDRLNIPLVTTFHTLARVKAEHGDPDSPEREAVEDELIVASDAICVSNPIEADQIECLYGANRSKLAVIPPGVDHAFFSPGDRRGARAALGLDDSPVVLFVGRIQPLKGLGLAVAALSEMSADVRLIVVGGPSGPDGHQELGRIRGQMASLGLGDRVTFIPPQPHHLLSTFYRSADVVIVPSRSESFGLVALEAAACGVPVVAAEVGGLRSLVVDGETGFLVDTRDPVDYAKRVEQLIDDPDLAASMGASAATRALDYSWPSAARALVELYEHRIHDRMMADSPQLQSCCA